MFTAEKSKLFFNDPKFKEIGECMHVCRNPRLAMASTDDQPWRTVISKKKAHRGATCTHTGCRELCSIDRAPKGNDGEINEVRAG